MRRTIVAKFVFSEQVNHLYEIEANSKEEAFHMLATQELEPTHKEFWGDTLFIREIKNG